MLRPGAIKKGLVSQLSPASTIDLPTAYSVGEQLWGRELGAETHRGERCGRRRGMRSRRCRCHCRGPAGRSCMQRGRSGKVLRCPSSPVSGYRTGMPSHLMFCWIRAVHRKQMCASGFGCGEFARMAAEHAGLVPQRPAATLAALQNTRQLSLLHTSYRQKQPPKGDVEDLERRAAHVSAAGLLEDSIGWPQGQAAAYNRLMSDELAQHGGCGKNMRLSRHQEGACEGSGRRERTAPVLGRPYPSRCRVM